MFRIAWRNLWRNRTRTLISVTAIALSYALFLVSISMADSMYDSMEVAAAQAAGGNVLVHQEGYWASQTNEKLIPDPAHVVAAAQKLPGVEAVATRLILEGLLSTSAASAGTRLMGIDPTIEKNFTNPARYLSKGEFFDDDESPIVLGQKTAKTLDVDLGDRVVFTTTAPDGEMRRALFYVSGIVAAGAASVDEGPTYTTILAAQNAIGVEGSVTQVGLMTDPLIQVATKNALAPSLGAGLEILTWEEAMPDLVGFIELDAAFGDLYGIIIFIVVVFAVMNTFLMIVMERIRELGLLAALGLKPSQIARLLVIESFLLAVVSILIGFSLGFAGHYTLYTYGIDVRDMYGTDMEMSGVTMVDSIIRSKITPERWINATLSVLGLVMLAAVYPAYKASRLNPSQAMRFFP